MIALLASLFIATNATLSTDADVRCPRETTPRELVMNCRTMIPANVELSGRIILRNRKGISQQEHDYVLTRSNSVTRLMIDGERVKGEGVKGAEGLLGTDVTWSDLTLDYLWWDDFSFDAEREGESVHGQICAVVVMKKGDRLVRVWVDRKTGALMQAEEYAGEKPVRRLWGTRLKKFGERWMANVLEVETIGSGHRTKITVETLK